MPLEVGDLIIADQDNPVDEGDWTEVNKNVDLATTTTVGVASFRGYASIDWGGMTSSAIIAILPMVLFAAFAQKHIVKGLTLGSVKG